MANIRDFLEARTQQPAPTGAHPDFLIDGRSYGSVFLLAAVFLLGNWMVVYAWLNSMRELGCGAGKGAFVCELFNAMPYPLSEIGMDLLGCFFIALAGAAILKKLYGYWRIAGFPDRIEFLRQDTVVSIPKQSLVAVLGSQTVKNTTVESFEFSDTSGDRILTVAQQEMSGKDWKRLKSFARGTAHFSEVPLVSKRIPDRIKALFKAR